MQLLRLSVLFESLILCLLFSSFTSADKAPSAGSQSDGKQKYTTARTMRGAGLERNVEIVCSSI
jgi:hypothetical protein